MYYGSSPFREVHLTVEEPSTVYVKACPVIQVIDIQMFLSTRPNLALLRK